jgi:hypothetical protein
MKFGIVLYIFLVIGVAGNLDCVVGCMERYEYLCGGCRCNSDKYNYVACTCPCTRIIAERGKCLQCGHYGISNRGEINNLNLMPFTYW